MSETRSTESNDSARVAIIDDKRLMRECLAQTLERSGFEVVLSVPGLERFLVWAGDARPEVVLADPLPGTLGVFELRSGLEAVQAVRDQYPSAPLLVVSGQEDPSLPNECLRRGAAGFLSKRSLSRDALVNAIRCALRGEQVVVLPERGRQREEGMGLNVLDTLTGREREILAYLAQGADNVKIANCLRISERTVKAHVSSLYRKLEVENRIELTLTARRLGVRAPPAG